MHLPLLKDTTLRIAAPSAQNLSGIIASFDNDKADTISDGVPDNSDKSFAEESSDSNGASKPLEDENSLSTYDGKHDNESKGC